MKTTLLTLSACMLIGCQTPSSNSGQLNMTATDLERVNKEKAVYCLDLLFNQHQLEQARSECFGETYIQHNPLAPDGVDALMAFLGPFFEGAPDAAIDIKRAAAEGDLVWIHYNNIFTPGERGLAVVDIFRMEDGKFIEHWDVAQPVPETSANDNTMF